MASVVRREKEIKCIQIREGGSRSVFMHGQHDYLFRKSDGIYKTATKAQSMGCLIQGKCTETTIILYRQSKMEINNSAG